MTGKQIWWILIVLSFASHVYCQTPEQDSKSPQSKEQQPTPSVPSGSPGHIFWIVPAFKVDYSKNFKPLTTKEKFQQWARGSYDPLGFDAVAAEAATLEHSSRDGFCGYGGGWAGYGKCFGSLQLDANISSFIGDFALTSVLHQDPRYFRWEKDLSIGGSGTRSPESSLLLTTQATLFFIHRRWLEPLQRPGSQICTTPDKIAVSTTQFREPVLISGTQRCTTQPPNSGRNSS